MGLIKNFLRDEEGLGVVEIALIIVVIIAIVAIFRTKVIELVNAVFDKIFVQMG